MAAGHNVEERLRLTMPENIRKPPTRWRLSSSGFAPAASAIENARRKDDAQSGMCCSETRSDDAVHEEDAGANSSVDRPKRQTEDMPRSARPARAREDHATRKAITMSRIVPLANPATPSPVRGARSGPAAATAMTEAVRMGRAFVVRKTIAPAKMAKTRHA